MNKCKFTLIEMLVVVAIIGILASMLLPAMQSAIESSRQIQCLNNVRQQGLGVNAYVSDWNGWLLVSNSNSNGSDPRGWKFDIARYLGITDLSYWWSRDTLRSGVFLCPSFKLPNGCDSKWGGGYGWNFEYMGRNRPGQSKGWWGTPRKNINKLGKLGQTILIGDTTDWFSGSSSGQQAQIAILFPSSYTNPFPPVGSRHNEGINLLWGDLHASWMSQSDLMTGAHGDEDWYYRAKRKK